MENPFKNGPLGKVARKIALGAALMTPAIGTIQASNNNEVIPTISAPEYSNVIYTKGADGKMSALPRAGVKGTKVLFPADAPMIDGPLVVKLEGSGDPQSLLEIGTGGKSFSKPVKFEAKDMGGRVFELTVGPANGECVLAFKVSGLALPTDIFAFRVAK
jgi:hypothetical protein